MFNSRFARLLLSGALALSTTNLALSQRITTITPSSVAVGGKGFIVTVAGSNFDSSAKVRLHTVSGVVDLPTYFINTGLLMAGVTAAQIGKAATLPLDVLNTDTAKAAVPVSLYVVGSGGGGGGTGGGGTGGGGTGGGGTGGGTSTALNVTVTSPTPNQTVGGSVTVRATATPAAGIGYWAISDGTTLVWNDINPDPSITATLALSPGTHDLKVTAYNLAGTPKTVSVQVKSSSPGKTVSWTPCMYTEQGQQYQAMKMSSTVTVTGVLQSEMYNGPGCNPANWTDQLNDYGSTLTLPGGGWGYIFFFIHRANIKNVSAVWTLGSQSSGCVNYATVPAC